ncbi:hypothetical protein [Pseudomonas sp.]|uniref:hypothetical protein n=1 Tax=Pseudomonas sp. TaxID=306 RepID=UPI003564758A
MKTLLGLSAVIAMLCYAPAYAACTPEEATAKSEQLAAKIAEITQSDPARAVELREELKDIRPQTSSEQLDNDCEAYDRSLQELEDAGKDVQEQGPTTD